MKRYFSFRCANFKSYFQNGIIVNGEEFNKEYNHTRRSLQSLSGKLGVYLLFCEGKCFYVGLSEDLARRLDRHPKIRELEEIFPQQSYFNICGKTLNSIQEARSTEKFLIKWFNPPLNNKPKSVSIVKEEDDIYRWEEYTIDLEKDFALWIFLGGYNVKSKIYKKKLNEFKQTYCDIKGQYIIKVKCR